MQILGQANRTGLALLGKAGTASSSVLRGAGSSGQAGQELQGEPKAVIGAGGRQAWGSHPGKGKN